MHSTASKRAKETGASQRRPREGGSSHETPDSRRVSAHQEQADGSPGVQFLAQLEARMNAPAAASAGVVQRVESITLTGKKNHKTFSVSKAAGMAFERLDESYGKVTEEQIEEALTSYHGTSTFDSMDAFMELVKSLLPPPTDVASDSDSSDSDSSDSDEEEELFDTKAIRSAVRGTLGEENEELESFYIGRLETLVGRMEAGAVGVRWLTLDQRQKQEVLVRLIQAMVSVGTAKGDPESFFDENTTILHGSYLFGAAGETPADIDLIVEGSKENKLGISGRLSREPKSDQMTVGSKSGIVDYMVGIPFSEADAEADLASDTPAELRDAAMSDLDAYLKAARKEEDEGKKWRKLVNISVAVDYMLTRFGVDDPGLKKYIESANNAIVGGSPPKATEAFFEAVEKGLKTLRKAE